MTGILCFSLSNTTDSLSSFCVASVLFPVEFHLMFIFIHFTIYNLPLPLLTRPSSNWLKNVKRSKCTKNFMKLKRKSFFNKSLITSFMCGLISNLCVLYVEKSRSTHLFFLPAGKKKIFRYFQIKVFCIPHYADKR